MQAVTQKHAKSLFLALIRKRLGSDSDGFKDDILITVSDLEDYDVNDAFNQLSEVLSKIEQDDEYVNPPVKIFQHTFENNNRDVRITGSTTERLILYSIKRINIGRDNLFKELNDEEYKKILPYLNTHKDVYDKAGDTRFKILGNNKAKAPKIEQLDNLPESFSWENVSLEFNENLHDMKITVHNRSLGDIDYERLGFVDKRKKQNPEATKAWAFLTQLAIILENRTLQNQSNQESTHDSPLSRILVPTFQEMARILRIEEGNCQQLKTQVSKNLRSAFGLDDDPFETYSPEEGYVPRFMLRPTPTLRKGKAEVFIPQRGEMNEETLEASDSLGISEGYNDATS